MSLQEHKANKQHTLADWPSMTKLERARFLKSCEVVAEIDIDERNLDVGFVARIIDFATLPCGYHHSDVEAVKAGRAWIDAKLAEAEAEAEDEAKWGLKAQ